MPDKPNRLKTVFQNLDRTFNGNWKDPYGSAVTHLRDGRWFFFHRYSR